MICLVRGCGSASWAEQSLQPAAIQRHSEVLWMMTLWQQSAHIMLLYCSDSLVFSSWRSGAAVCVSCVEPWRSKQSWVRVYVCLCVSVMDVLLQESRMDTGVPGQHSAADSAVNLGLASCPQLGENGQYWGQQAKLFQNPHLCVLMIQKGPTTRFGKSSVNNSMDWEADFNPSFDITDSWSPPHCISCYLVPSMALSFLAWQSPGRGQGGLLQGLPRGPRVGSCWRCTWACSWGLCMGLSLKACPGSHRWTLLNSGVLLDRCRDHPCATGADLLETLGTQPGCALAELLPEQLQHLLLTFCWFMFSEKYSFC